MKTDLPHFSHDSNAHKHPKMLALRSRYGWIGYAHFWVLNEKIAASENVALDLSRNMIKSAIACELGLSNEDFEDFLLFLADESECGLINYVDGIVTTDRTREDYKRVMEKREEWREYAAKKKKTPVPESDSFQLESDRKQTKSTTVPTGNKKNPTGIQPENKEIHTGKLADKIYILSKDSSAIASHHDAAKYFFKRYEDINGIKYAYSQKDFVIFANLWRADPNILVKRIDSYFDNRYWFNEKGYTVGSFKTNYNEISVTTQKIVDISSDVSEYGIKPRQVNRIAESCPKCGYTPDHVTYSNHECPCGGFDFIYGEIASQAEFEAFRRNANV